VLVRRGSRGRGGDSRHSDRRHARREPEARVVLQNLLREDPGYVAAALELGGLESALGHYKESELLHRQVLKTAPTNLAAITGLAEVLVAQGKPAQAFELLAALRGKIPQVPLELATAQVATAASRPDLAIKAYSAVPESELPAEAMSKYAEALLRSGSKVEAIRLAKAAAAKAPDQPQRAAFAGYVLESNGLPDEAIQQYEAALRTAPENSQVANNLAFLLASKSMKLDRAQALAEQCVRAQPENHRYVDTLGYVYKQRGQHAAAVDAFQRAARLGPNEGTYQLHLAQACKSAGDASSARKAATAALALNLANEEKEEAKNLLTSLR